MLDIIALAEATVVGGWKGQLLFEQSGEVAMKMLVVCYREAFPD